MRFDTPNGTFEIVDINFQTRVPDNLYMTAAYQVQRTEYLMRQAEESLVRELTQVDGAFEVKHEYDIASMGTLYNHRLQVLRRIKDGTK